MAASMATAWLSDRVKIRWPVRCTQSLFTAAGLLIRLYGKVPAFRYFGLFISVYGSQANGPQILSWAQNQAPTMANKGILPAIMITVGAVGGVTGSTIFRSQDAPVCLPLDLLFNVTTFSDASQDYLSGMGTAIASQFVSCLVIFGGSMYFKQQNRLLDEGKATILLGGRGFRYKP